MRKGDHLIDEKNFILFNIYRCQVINDFSWENPLNLLPVNIELSLLPFFFLSSFSYSFLRLFFSLVLFYFLRFVVCFLRSLFLSFFVSLFLCFSLSLLLPLFFSVFNFTFCCFVLLYFLFYFILFYFITHVVGAGCDGRRFG